MDIFKLAFDTTLVGLLTFLWLGLAIYFLFPDKVEALLFPAKQKPLPPDKQKALPRLIDSATSDKSSNAALGVGVLTLAYCLGSAIVPISNQFVNDEHWPLNENAIRCQVFLTQELNLRSVNESALPKAKGISLEDVQPRHCSYWAPLLHPDDTEKTHTAVRRFLKIWLQWSWPGGDNENEALDEHKREQILTLFQQQEAAVLNLSRDSENTERLRQLHERTVVLRGFVFSLFNLCMMFIFALLDRVDGEASHLVKMVLGILLTIVFLAFAVSNGWHDFKRHDINDIPVLETFLAATSIFGLVVIIKGIKSPAFSMKRCLLLAVFALFFASLAYGGWMWSEVLYDQQVTSSFALLQKLEQTR